MTYGIASLRSVSEARTITTVFMTMACSHCGYDPSQDQPLLLPILPENTPSESTEIRKYLSICRARAGVLDRRIERVERALDILCACREHAQALKGVNKDVEEAEGVSGIKVEFREFFPGSPKVSPLLM